MDYLCMPCSYFWGRTSENPQKAKFAEWIIHAPHEKYRQQGRVGPAETNEQLGKGEGAAQRR
jgi:hypothetical protein